jgi:hypothetical protein
MDKRRFFLCAALFATALAAIHPCRNLLASYYYHRAAAVLDDPATGERDVVDISAETMPVYRESIGAILRAEALAPARSLYCKALADVYLRMGRWSAAMESVGLPLPAGAITGNDGCRQALADLRRAVALEPANPDLHLALARVYASEGERGPSERELQAAVQAAPVNSALRYEIAVHCLLRGEKNEALEHAQALAAFDDSYLLPDSPRKRFLMERRTPGYRALLAGSYLFKALEIGWRASGKNADIVRRMVPPGDEAQQVWQLFEEWKGL